ncbi:unnamed protein product [Caenorhabditis nigoni]
MDGDEPAPKKAKLESPQERPQERGPGVPPTLTSPFTPDENRVGTGSTTAKDRQSSTNLAVVPWPIPPSALIEDRVSPPRDGIHKRPAGAANQRRRPPNPVLPFNQRQDPSPPPDFPFPNLWPILRQEEYADFLAFLRLRAE